MTLKAKLGKTLSNLAKLTETSKDIFEEKELWLRPRLKTVVESLQANVLKDVPVSPVVAGGFLRDTLVGVRPKDMDIFIQFDPSLDEFDRDHYRALIAERIGSDDAGSINQPFYGLEDMTANYGKGSMEPDQILDGVLQFCCAGIPCEYEGDGMYFPPDIQLIGHRQEPYELLDRFDLNICKVAYLPHRDEFIYTPEFLEDYNNKTVTLDLRYQSNLSSQARYARISQKMNRIWKPEETKTKTYGDIYTSTSDASIWTTGTGSVTRNWNQVAFQEQAMNAERAARQAAEAQAVGNMPAVWADILPRRPNDGIIPIGD